MKAFLSEGKDGKFRWSCKDAHGETVAYAPQPYDSPEGARRAYERFRRKIDAAPVIVVEDGE